MEENAQEMKIKTSAFGKVMRVAGVLVVAGLIVAAVVASMAAKPSNAEKVWDSEMTMGNMEAKNYFIIYSDIVCPYCVAFENAMIEHEEELEQYIKDNDILIEVRMSDFLYEYGQAQAISSRYSAEGTYCAKREGKFWDYYNLAITTVWKDYFSGGGKGALMELNKKGKDYWIALGKKVGLSDEFAKCVEEDETLAEIEKNAEKTSKLANGMPYFKFNSWTSSGFDLAWGWDYVLMYFESGLKG